MKSKSDQSWLKNCEETNLEFSHAPNQEQALELMKTEQKIAEDNWAREGLPKLVDEIIKNYETYVGMSHIEGKDLPSKQVVIEVLEELLSVMFPGYVGKTDITLSNVRYFLGTTLNSVYSRFVDEVEKSLKYVCRTVKECPQKSAIDERRLL